MEEELKAIANFFGDLLQNEVIERSSLFDIEKGLPLELTQQELAKLFGCSVGNLYRYTSQPDFPKIDRGKGSHIKYPRDAVRDWYLKHWNECV